MIDLQVGAIASRVVGAVIDGLEIGDGDALLIHLDDGQALWVQSLQLVRREL
jgi:outer membrane lipoprotein SlyB